MVDRLLFGFESFLASFPLFLNLDLKRIWRVDAKFGFTCFMVWYLPYRSQLINIKITQDVW